MSLTTAPLNDNDASWVAQQLSDGALPETLVQPLLDVGWPPEAVYGHLNLPIPPKPVYKAVPNISNEHNNRIDVGDREVELIASMQFPRILVFGNVLSDYECDKMKEAAIAKGLKRSHVVNLKEAKTKEDHGRTSEGTFFNKSENELIARIEKRIEVLLNWPAENGEGLQVIHYTVGGEYRHHHDHFIEGSDSFLVHTEHGGNRVGTLIMYLDNTPEGGGTDFGDIDLKILPKKGYGVFFSYPTQSKNDKVFHAGLPVVNGDKWIMTKWLREGVTKY